MFRTRDFLVFLLTASFLVVAIMLTIKFDATNGMFSENDVFSKSDEVEYEAVLPEAETIDRESRVKELSKKIKESDMLDSLLASVVTTTVVEEDEETPEDSLEDASFPGLINKCANYTTQTPNWSPYGIKSEVIEGARIFYREPLGVVDASSSGLSDREIVLQLPVRSFPFPTKHCINSDVVGVAIDGSLLKNNEQAVYGIFGAETLVGYALDGFPIYGLNNGARTDQCGGLSIGGQYRYYLSSDREGIIGCYSGTPVNL